MLLSDVRSPKATNLDAAALAEAARICACFNFRKASRAVTQLFDAMLQPSGLRSTQFVMLVAIGAGARPRLPDLACALSVDRSTLTRNLKPLVREGLVRLKESRGGRASEARLTPKGERAVAATLPFWEGAQARFVEQFGARRWDAMLKDLTRVVETARGA